MRNKECRMCGKVFYYSSCSKIFCGDMKKKLGCSFKHRQEKNKIFNVQTRKRDLGLSLSYHSAKNRCTNKNNQIFYRYGGRGIKFEWRNYEDFKDDMYKSYLEHLDIYGKKNTSLDRINNNGNYCKENCRWATWEEQNNNRENSISDINCYTCKKRFHPNHLIIKTCSKKCGYIYREKQRKLRKLEKRPLLDFS